jgi:hypothetical protein
MTDDLNRSGRDLLGLLSLHFLGQTEENHKNPQSGYPVSRPEFELSTPRTRYLYANPIYDVAEQKRYYP